MLWFCQKKKLYASFAQPVNNVRFISKTKALVFMLPNKTFQAKKKRRKIFKKTTHFHNK